jgi:hypothetical protein
MNRPHGLLLRSYSKPTAGKLSRCLSILRCPAQRKFPAKWMSGAKWRSSACTWTRKWLVEGLPFAWKTPNLSAYAISPALLMSGKRSVVVFLGGASRDLLQTLLGTLLGLRAWADPKCPKEGYHTITSHCHGQSTTTTADQGPASPWALLHDHAHFALPETSKQLGRRT